MTKGGEFGQPGHAETRLPRHKKGPDRLDWCEGSGEIVEHEARGSLSGRFFAMCD